MSRCWWGSNLHDKQEKWRDTRLVPNPCGVAQREGKTGSSGIVSWPGLDNMGWKVYEDEGFSNTPTTTFRCVVMVNVAVVIGGCR